MDLLGISMRRRRLEGPDGRLLLLALDHGLPAGPLPGIEDPAGLLRRLRGSALTGIIANPGLLRLIAPEVRGGLVVHLSAGTLLGFRPTSKVLAASVESAVRLGADAVSVHVHFGDPQEDRMVADAGRIADDAHRLGVPLLVMGYGPSDAGRGSTDSQAAAHAARASAEIGADLVQTNYAGAADGVEGIVRGCPVPLLLAGGPKVVPPEAYLASVRAAIAAGAAGVTVGRHLFQDTDPSGFATRLADVVFRGGPRIPLEVSR